jgi:restriction alleviation protein Lar
MPAKKKSSKLYPCPFCESSQWAMLQTADEKTFNVICLSCYATGPDASSPKEAKEKWQKREAETPLW